jgi:hypothetical protein
MNTPSKTVQAAQRLLADRERVGLAKYGTTVDRTDLAPGDWLQHAIEETSDLLLYLIRLRETMRPEPDLREAVSEMREVMGKYCGCRARLAGECPGEWEPGCDMGVNEANAVPAGEGAEAALQQAKAYRAAHLARWANAPAEATHLAEDSDGRCHWWRSEGAEFGGGPPVMSDGQWFEWSGCNHLAVAGSNLLGRVACEPRPGAEGER